MTRNITAPTDRPNKTFLGFQIPKSKTARRVINAALVAIAIASFLGGSFALAKIPNKFLAAGVGITGIELIPIGCLGLHIKIGRGDKEEKK